MSGQLAQRRLEVKERLLSSQKQITSLLQDKDKSDKFMAASLVVAGDESLASCTPASIVRALTQVAMLDLSVDKNLGHAYLIPYKDCVQLQIGAKGYKEIIKRNGFSSKELAVYNCDVFKERLSENLWDKKIEFEPNYESRKNWEPKWVIENMKGVIVLIKNDETGDIFHDFISVGIIEKLRMSSRGQTTPINPKTKSGYGDNIWYKWYEEQACLKALKKVCKKWLGNNSQVASVDVIEDVLEVNKVTHTSSQTEYEKDITPHDVKKLDVETARKKFDMEAAKKGVKKYKAGVHAGAITIEKIVAKIENAYDEIDDNAVEFLKNELGASNE